jgi:hypothetical protein
MSFGRRIKQLREEKGVRQEDIGNLYITKIYLLTCFSRFCQNILSVLFL